MKTSPLVVFSLLLVSTGWAAAPISSADLEFFETRIRPVLADQCYRCHSAKSDRARGGLLLDTKGGLLEGGDSGPALVPGDPDKSLLIEAIGYGNPDLRMPPKGNKLPDDIIADFAEWIRRGAPDPRVEPAVADSGKAARTYAPSTDHWSFKPVVSPAVPVTAHPGWCRTPVDNFILAGLEAAGMKPSPATDRRTLLRRVTYDLTGLPPTTAEIDAFVNDPAPDAYAKVVDRLLASPRYGEHAARQWLDIVRYADTKGTIKRREDPRYPNAWTYRDYVIDAFNSDKPYDAFITEQLAADRLVMERLGRKTLPKDTDPGDRSILAALGFLAIGNKFDGNANDVINDRIDVTGKAFLGLTVSCARCHDHKFDPIPTQDYYSLYGVFANTTQPRREADMPTLAQVVESESYRDYMAKSAELETRQTELAKEFRALRAGGKDDPDARRKLLRDQARLAVDIGDLDNTHPGAPARAEIVTDARFTKDYPVLIRGEAQSKGEVVPRRFLAVLSPDPARRPVYTQGSGRLELARDIADPKNPLTARVLVNRLWQQHFGEGFVPTPEDLGNQSAPPSNAALIDYLAARFVEGGWSIKNLHRLIVMSATYQQGDSLNAKYAEQDPHNRLLWRYNLRRLGFEEMHDSILAIAGQLDSTIGGKSVRLSSEGFATRRALYTFVDRGNPPELFTQFDFPNPDVPSGRRYETTVPQQALFFMNNPFVIETARKLTQRPEFVSLKRDEDRVTSLYLAILQRAPTVSEIRLATRYVAGTPAGSALSAPSVADTPRRQRPGNFNLRNRLVDNGPVGGATNQGPLDAWARLAHALFQTNEAIYYN